MLLAAYAAVGIGVAGIHARLLLRDPSERVPPRARSSSRWSSGCPPRCCSRSLATGRDGWSRGRSPRSSRRSRATLRPSPTRRCASAACRMLRRARNALCHRDSVGTEPAGTRRSRGAGDRPQRHPARALAARHGRAHRLSGHGRASACGWRSWRSGLPCCGGAGGSSSRRAFLRRLLVDAAGVHGHRGGLDGHRARPAALDHPGRDAHLRSRDARCRASWCRSVLFTLIYIGLAAVVIMLIRRTVLETAPRGRAR